MNVHLYVCMYVNKSLFDDEKLVFFKFPKLKYNINKMGIISLHSFVKILKYRNWP